MRAWGSHALCRKCGQVRTKHQYCASCATKETRYMEKKMTKKEQYELYREQAKRTYEDEGTLEIADDAKVSQCETGAYVQAWVWVSDEDAKVTR